jgi:outer membrane protein OmpA-like peptidoglycan-associated protein
LATPVPIAYVEEEITVKKFEIVFGIAAVASLASGCVASHKYVKKEVNTSSEQLTAKHDSDIGKVNGEIKETQDGVADVNKKVATVDQRVTGVDQRVAGVDQKVTGVDGKVTDLDTRTTQGMTSLKSDVNSVNGKAESANRDVASLDQKFKNRNNFEVSMQKAIPFKFDSADLQATGKPELDEIASVLTQNPDALIVLEGHTDSTGNAEYNMKLGERRVDAIRRYLAIEKNIPVYKIEQISFGAAKPLAPNDSKDGREKNRSVSVMVLVPSASSNATASISK